MSNWYLTKILIWKILLKFFDTFKLRKIFETNNRYLQEDMRAFQRQKCRRERVYCLSEKCLKQCLWRKVNLTNYSFCINFRKS